MVFHTFSSLDVNLRRKVALGIDLVIHGKRSVLRITEILLCVSLIDSKRKSFLVTIACPDLLAFFAMDNGSSGVLAERELALCSHLCVAKESQRNIFVVLARLWIRKDFCNLSVMLRTQHKRHVTECGICHSGQTFLLNLKHRLAFKFPDRHMVLSQKVVFSLVLTKLKHRCIFEFHNIIVEYINLYCRP